MKKIKFIVLSLLLLLTFTGCGKSNVKDLSYSKLKDMISDEETFFFVVVRDGCSFCEKFVPILEEVTDEYEITGYKLNIAKMSEDEYNEFDSIYNVDGTPTTIFIEKGKETSLLQRIDGYVGKEKLISKLENTGYIKK